MQRTLGIHHITAITADPQMNIDFYEGFLGQRLVKKTVNFDDPSAYHLYYGDAIGTPGTIMTFFYWPGVPAGTRGHGEVGSVYYAVLPESLSYWQTRAETHHLPYTTGTLPFGEEFILIQDPDGLEIGLVATTDTNAVTHWEDGPIPREHSLRGFYGALLSLPPHVPLAPVLEDGLGYEPVATEQSVTRYQATIWPGKFLATKELPGARATQGAGSIHHIAFGASDDTARDALRRQVMALGLFPTGMIDRQYFHSTYFMTPAGILFEIATTDIGFTVDEEVEELGEHLKLPPQYEAQRTMIEQMLTPVTLPRHAHDQ